MPNVSFRLEVTGLKEMQKSFQKAASPVGARQVSAFDRTFGLAARAVYYAVHVETRKLRLSGRMDTHFDGSEWSGEMEFARYPGIFELARGNAPSKNHPEGGHFFFNAVEPFIPVLDDNVDAVFRAAFNEKAPI